eukprot:CAMPEP_0196739736 /NCGR_PEP_ID=MMETSP1091-20130531/24964_1 /TAXON_ID=302021 /ORGANISM="Rhodomonas sp., Strain CCMP768" /LENGTH=51 /DNA_ID=CAMNT_0042084451 /DNA_START=145 /DNA_END=296 /DNA_ORIENTATION=-
MTVNHHHHHDHDGSPSPARQFEARDRSSPSRARKIGSIADVEVSERGVGVG